MYYAVTVTSRALPTTLPAGWTNPASVVLNGLAPQLLIGATNWGKLLGFATGSYPAVQGSLTLQFNSTLVPEISPVTSVLVLCDWVNDTRFNYRPSVIASFTPSSTFGSIINYRPITLLKYDITPSNYQGIQVRFVDQEYRPLRMLDTKQTLISLIVES